MLRIKCLPLLLVAACIPAWAGDAAIGFVKTVSGNASVIHGGNAIRAQVGTPIEVRDVLKTGADGSLGVTFKDNTVISIGPDTELSVDEYRFSPGTEDLKFGANIVKGTLQVITGIIAKLKPESVAIRTPSATIGIRGTRFAVKVEP